MACSDSERMVPGSVSNGGLSPEPWRRTASAELAASRLEPGPALPTALSHLESPVAPSPSLSRVAAAGRSAATASDAKFHQPVARAVNHGERLRTPMSWGCHLEP